MSALPVIAVFDIGKTNKKMVLIDEQYHIVLDHSVRLPETLDEDGYPCENAESLQSFVFENLRVLDDQKKFNIKAVNFSAYGASFVYLDKKRNPTPTIYNYLKSYPQNLKQQFYKKYGGEQQFSFRTASPVLDSLNSGLQLYRIKQEKPHLFLFIKTALHLPQFMSFLLTGKTYSDLTSIGCHTGLWDFTKNNYHDWVYQEGIAEKLAPVVSSDHVEHCNFRSRRYLTGIGLHDSSAALIPFLISFREPFVLIATGTWSISLNPFNHTPLTREELQNDCLCYLNYEGKPVKASRLFAGHEHEEQNKRIAGHFGLDNNWSGNIVFDPEVVARLQKKHSIVRPEESCISSRISAFACRDIKKFTDPIEAYHQLIMDIVIEQYASVQFIIKDTPVKRIFVDGAFSQNKIYMNLLAAAFKEMEVYASEVAQSTAVGAALAIHHHWNKNAIPGDLVKLKSYSYQKPITK